MIPVARPDLSGKELEYVTEAVRSSWVSSQGEFIERFEADFAKVCGTNYATSCSNGTAALHLALLALEIGAGDEVIVPTLTFAATAAAVRYVGANPVLVDVKESSWNIDPGIVLEKITSKTRAVVPVHLYGSPCDMSEIMGIAKKHGLVVIEDAAEASGASYKGKKVGSMGDIGCFSFYGNKILTTGEGGMLTTNSKTLFDKINLLKNHGMGSERYWHEIIGYNYRMTNLQAAIGCAQLERIEEMLERREEIAREYKSNLTATFQQPEEGGVPVNWLFSCLVKDQQRAIQRLKSAHIDSRSVFNPLHRMPPYRSGEAFPSSEKIAKYGVTLPTYTQLRKEEVERICITLRDA